MTFKICSLGNQTLLCISLAISLVSFLSAQEASTKHADSLFQMGHYEKVIDELDRKQRSPQTQYIVALSYLNIGNYPKAASLLNEVIILDGTNLKAKNELGKLYFRTSEMEKSKEIFEDLILRDPLNPNYYLFLGRILRRQKDSLYIESFRSMLKLAPANLKGIEEVAKYHLLKKQFDSAVYYCQLGLIIHPRNFALVGYKGQAHFLAKQDSLAVVEYEKLREAGMGNETVLGKLAYAHYNLRHYPESIARCIEYLDLSPYSSEYHYLLGLNYYESNEFDLSAAAFQQSIELKKVSNANEYLRLIDIYKQQQDHRNAIKYYKLLVNEQPDYIMGYYQIAYLGDQYYRDSDVKIYHYKQFLKKARIKKNGYLEKYREYAKQRLSELIQGIHFETDDG